MFHVEQIFPREEEKRVAKIVAIANQKGGVGKTTTAVNLSSCVAALGKKVLIVDLDPQGNTTTGYGIPKRSVEYGTYEVLIGRASAAQAIRHTEYRTDVIGSNTRLAGASLEMIDLPARESRLRKALAPIAAGDRLGEITVSYGDTTYVTVPLLAVADVSASRFLSLRHAIGEFFSQRSARIAVLALVVLVAALVLWFRFYGRNRRYGKPGSKQYRHHSYRGRRH